MHPRTPFSQIADFSIGKRSRWIVIVLWVAAIGALTAYAPKLAGLYDNNASSSIGNTESVQASALLQKEFPAQNGLPAIIVFYDKTGLTQDDLAQADAMTCWLLSSDQQSQYHCVVPSTPNLRPAGIGAVVAPLTIPQAKSQLISADNTTLTVIASITASPSDLNFSTVVMKNIKAYATNLSSNNLQIQVSGPAGVIADLGTVFANINVKILLTTVILVLVLLLAIYRSPVLAILPLIAVGFVLQVVDPIIALLVKGGAFSVTAQSAGIRDVLLFGAGTDYVIFLVARYREELQHTADRFFALKTATLGVSEAITSSAGTVILALLTLLLTTLGFYKTLGPLLAVSIATMLLAGLTLVPALLSLLGNVAFWPFIPKLMPVGTEHVESGGFWKWVADRVVSNPLVSVIFSGSLLIFFALGNIGISAVYNSLTGLRSPTGSAIGYQILAKHFSPGTLAPLSVVIHMKDGSNAYTHLQSLDAISQAIASTSGVAAVTGPTRPDGKAPAMSITDLQNGLLSVPPAITQSIRAGTSLPPTSTTSSAGPPSGIGASVAAGQLNPMFIGLYASTVQYISDDLSTVRLTVTVNTDPYSKAALDLMSPIRTAARSSAHNSGLSDAVATVQLTGVTPQLADTRTVNNRDKSITIPLILILVAITLGVLLRSILAPLYLLAAVTLNYFAALGISSFFFVHVQGDEGLSYAAPLYTFIFLVALGADYTIFLMSRVREETYNSGIKEGTRMALSRTGGVITSAGLILAGTFTVLATLPLRDLYQLGVTVAVGILLDTFIVRGFLVPGIVLLLKDANWWPGKIRMVESQ